MAKTKFQFHYTPTGTGVISGPEVLKQTEDAINDVGAYADQASDNSSEALSIAKEARQTAQTAAQTAESKAVEAASNAYAVRVIDQVLTASGTIQIADLKPQGNIKAGDTVVGTDGRMFRITSVNATAGTALLSADYTDLTPSVSYEAPQTLSATQQNTARSNIGFSAGVDSWADDSFNDRTDDYLCPILEELILENGGTQQEIDDIKNAQTGQDTGTENP